MANQVCVLGPIRVVRDNRTDVDAGGMRQRRLLAALAASSGDVVSVDSLVDIVFDGNPTEAAERTLQSYVSRLRNAVDTPESRGNGSAIERVGSGYVLRLAPGDLDADDFERQVHDAREAAAAGDHAAAVRTFDLALRSWHGRPFAEFADEEWVIAESQRLVEIRATAIEDRAESQLALGGHAEVIADLERFVREEATRERPRAQLMLALYRSGRQAEALRVYQDYFGFMRDEMGLQPSKALSRLEGQMIAGDPELDVEPLGGTSLRGYRLYEELGRGAFSVVHRGTQPSVGRDVAVKVIRSGLANEADFIRRFETEAHMVANLEHPHIVPLYDFWREPDNAYLVMRWLRGGTLRDRIDDGPLELTTAATMIRHVGGALEVAHRQGIVHRDIKPANVFCDDEGNFYLGDFGIAVGSAAADQDHVPATVAPAYASPELLEHGPVGPSADIYSLGLTVFETLTGVAPYADSRSDAELVNRQVHEPLPLASSVRPGVPIAVEQVIQRATAKSAMGRFGSAREFVTAFLAAVEGRDRGAPRPISPTVPSLDPGPNPYKGLRAFGEADAADFFGRSKLVGELLEHLRHDGPDGRFVTVVGPSGSGKSSLVRAGLVPALREGVLEGSEGWFVATVMPGSSPFAEVEAALLRLAVNPPASLLDQLVSGADGLGRAVKRILPDDEAELLLVVDQFEELFTLASDEGERARFVDALLAAADDPRSRVRVVSTLRADFYDRPLRDSRVADRVKQSTVVVTPLASDELAEAITHPARRAGARFEDGLVARITADVVDQPGALPLLQYTLAELYDRSSGTLSHDQYEAIGRVPGALATRAEAIYDDLDDAARAGTRLLFTRLVTLGDDSEDTRRRVKLTELDGDVGIAAAIQAYGDSRLLTFDRDVASREPTVEVAHEALIREWPRFRGWVDDDRDGLRIHRHLTAAATAWQARGEDDAELYRGSRLAGSLTWAETHPGVLNALERRFLAESRSAADREAVQRARQTRRLRRSLAAVAGVAVVALVAGLLAARESRRATDARELAEQQRDVAQEARDEAGEARTATEAQAELARESARQQLIRTLREQAVNAPDPVTAILLATQAHDLDPGSAVALDAIGHGLLKEPGWMGALPGTWIHAAPELESIVTGEGDELVVRSARDPWDIVRRIAVGSEDPDHPVAPDLAPDGTRIAIGTDQGIQIVDLATGEHGSPVSSGDPPADFPAAEWTSNTQLLVNDDPVGVYRVSGLDLELVDRIDLPFEGGYHPGAIMIADTSRQRLAVHTQRGRVEIWDTERIGQPGHLLAAHELADPGVLIPSWGGRGELMVASIEVGDWGDDVRDVYWTTGIDPLSDPTPVETDRPTVWRVTELENGEIFAGGLGESAVINHQGETVAGPWPGRDGATPQSVIELDEDRLVLGSISTGSLEAGHNTVWSRSGGNLLTTPAPLLEVPEGMMVQHFADEQIATLSPEASSQPVLYHAIHVAEVWDLSAATPRRVAFENEDEIDRMRLSLTDDGPVVVALFDERVDGNGRLSPHAAEGGVARVLDARSGDTLGSVDIPHRDSISGFYVSADRSELTVFGNHWLQFFDIAENRPTGELPTDGNAQWVVRREDLGRGFAVAESLTIYDLETHEVLDEIELVDGPLEGDTRLLPDAEGDTVVIGGNPLSLLDLDDATITTFENPRGLAGRLDPAGRFVVGWGSGAADGVQLWDVASRQMIGPFVPGPVGDQHLGGEIAQVRDGWVHLWNPDPATWPELACRVAGRTMTRQEWSTYLGDDLPYEPACTEHYPID